MPRDTATVVDIRPQADRDEIARFVQIMFARADHDTFISLRAFIDGKEQDTPFDRDHWATVPVGDAVVVEHAVALAQRCATASKAAVFCPPVCTFKDAISAGAGNLANGLAVVVECDANPTASLKRLEAILGPATVVVASGGLWRNPTTGDNEPKLHIYWVLAEPTRTDEEHGRLKAARRLACELVGADATAVPIVHPLRWPGSLHRKSTPRLARIFGGNSERAINLDEKLPILMDEAGWSDVEIAREPGQREAPLAALQSALDVLPNADLDWDEWNKTGLALWAATGGSDSGLALWAMWSAKSEKNDPQMTRARWAHFKEHPPNSIGAGSIFYWAKRADPNWQLPKEKTWLTKNGVIVANAVENLELAVERLELTLKYDEFARRMLVNGEPMTDELVNHFWFEVERRFAFSPKNDKWFKFIIDAAMQNRFHPVRDYLGGLIWDGVKRIDTWLINYAGARDSEYVRAVSRLVLIAAVRRVRQPGCKFDEMLILQSKTQGWDKSTALATLAVRPEWFTDSVDLGLSDKEANEQLPGRWIAEISDLRNRKRDVAHVKAFLSRQVDSARKAYGRLREDVPRQCVLFGTTNEERWAIDPTGNRRFWPVTLGRPFDVEALRRNRDQLWAEAAAAEAAGESIRLSELLWKAAGEAQDAITVADPWVDALAAVGLETMKGQIRSVDVWTILDIEPGRQTQEQNNRMGQAMRKLGWEARQIRCDGQRVSGYVKGTADEREKKRIFVDRDTVIRALSVGYGDELDV